MLYKRTGMPEEDEIVFCKVSKIFPNSVFVDLLEFGTQGMIDISEIAPGRIRNLRDFVTQDRQIVCKVLRIDQRQGHIDLSLRRVNSHERAGKLEEIKQELKAEALVKSLSEKLKVTFPELYQKISPPIFKEFSHLYLCFKEVVAGAVDLQKIGIEQKIAQELTTAIIDKFKPQKIAIGGEIKMQTYASDGVDKIRSTLLVIEKISSTIALFYLGGGRYKLTIEDVDYKPAEQTLDKIVKILEKFNDKQSTASFEREKKE
ncbi:S1 RNA-binding domain-containing protein [Candidatus Woesearchaeota archaeon]|nr:S1 RNA-binding domain-containing protein [Candidatus Woesearchaeota archaeon]